MDQIKTSFEPMGPSGMGAVVNISGARSPYTKAVPVGGVPSGVGIDGPTAPAGAAQPATLVNAEVLGPCCKPITTLYYPNAAGHEQTGRNVKLLAPRTGTSSFWDQRG
jgi:hypothetical protein